MKELSIEEKAKRYDEVVNKLKRFMEQGIDPLITMTDVQDFFPEIQENEDERIRQKFIKLVKMSSEVGGFALHKWEADEMLAWLERQGNTPKEVTCTQEVEVGNGNINALVTEKITIDKVEPKFHEGDWIVYNNDICQIVKREEGCNKLVTVFGIEKELVNERNLSTARLWTIQDAKEGDVLANDHHILILKELYYDWYSRYSNGTPYSVKAYCGIKPSGNFEIGKDNWCFCGTLHIHPATKEQRDLLFSKMKEACYEFDFKEKELKKIEQKSTQGIEPFEAEHGKYYYCIKDYFCGGKKQASKGDVVQALRGLPIMGLNDASEYFLPVNFIKCNSVCGEEDERIRKELIDYINRLTASPNYIDKYNTWIAWLEKQGKPKWTEEDESKVKEIVYFLDTAKVHYASTTALDDCIEWLKSLKQKMEE